MRMGVIAFRGSLHCGLFLLGYYAFHEDLTNIDWMVVLGGAIGSYLPDCDIKTSTAGGIIPMWLFTKHREQTHSLYFAVLCSCLFGVVNLSLGLGILVGMLLHYLGDLTTAMGRLEGLRMLYWPYQNKYKKTQYKKSS